MKAFDLTGKQALVTGSTRGIGKAIAVALIEAGARVMLHGSRPTEQGEQALAEARKLDSETKTGYLDLSLPDAAERMRGQLTEAELDPDILVLNVAVQTRKPFAQVSREDMDWQIQTNFISTYRMIQLFSPGMLERGWGRIVCIGSVQEALPHPDFTVYAAMKSAQKNLVENLARQFGPKGVTVNNLSPGVFITDRNEAVLKEENYANLVLEKIPVRFFAESRDCAGAALLLCSEAGRYINGATLPVDGGMSLPK